MGMIRFFCLILRLISSILQGDLNCLLWWMRVDSPSEACLELVYIPRMRRIPRTNSCIRLGEAVSR